MIQIQTHPSSTMFERCSDVSAELSHILAGVGVVTGAVKEESRGRNKHCFSYVAHSVNHSSKTTALNVNIGDRRIFMGYNASSHPKQQADRLIGQGNIGVTGTGTQRNTYSETEDYVLRQTPATAHGTPRE